LRRSQFLKVQDWLHNCEFTLLHTKGTFKMRALQAISKCSSLQNNPTLLVSLRIGRKMRSI
jgi:hypothetical protein